MWWYVRLLIGLVGLTSGGLLFMNEEWRRFAEALIVMLISLSALFLLQTILRRILAPRRFVLFDLVILLVGILGAALSVFLPTITIFDGWIVFSIGALLALVYDIIRPRFRRIALAFLVVFVIGFFVSGLFALTRRISRYVYTAVQAGRQTGISQGGVSQPLADLAMISVTGVHTLSWNENQKKYDILTEELGTKETEDEFYVYRRIFADSDSLYVVYDDIIERRPRNGSSVIQWKRPNAQSGLDLTNSRRIGAVEFRNGFMYVSANGKLYILNSSLRALGEIDLKIADGSALTKNAHDILLSDNVALLLDNLAEPFYVFTVDVQNPEQPLVRNRRGGFTINGHLKAQWLDGLNNWNIVLTDQTGYGGTAFEERVAVLPKDEYTTRLSPEQFTTWQKEHPLPKGSVIGGRETITLGVGGQKEYGYSLLRDSNRSDGYFLVHDRETRNVLVTKIGSNFQLLNPVSLDRFEQVHTSSFLFARDVLYIALQNKLYVVTIGGNELTLVHSQEFPTNISDLAILEE